MKPAHRIIPIIALLLLAGSCRPVQADQAAAYQDAAAFAGTQKSLDPAANSTNTTNVPQYTASPPETSYYGNSGNMAADGNTAAQTSDVGTFMAQSQDRPLFIIDKNTDPVLVRSMQVTTPTNLSNFLAQFGGCYTEQQIVPGAVTPATCEEYRKDEFYTCAKDLVVAVGIRATCTHLTWFADTGIKTAYYGDNFYWSTRAFCDLTRNDGMQDIGYYTHGEVGGNGWQSATVPTTPQPNWTRLPDGRQCGGYGNGCYPVHMYYRGAGCSVTDCSYEFIFGSYGSSWSPTYSCPSPSQWGELYTDTETGVTSVVPGGTNTNCYTSVCTYDAQSNVTTCAWVISGQASPAGGFVGDTLNFTRPRYELYITSEEWTKGCAGLEAREL